MHSTPADPRCAGDSLTVLSVSDSAWPRRLFHSRLGSQRQRRLRRPGEQRRATASEQSGQGFFRKSDPRGDARFLYAPGRVGWATRVRTRDRNDAMGHTPGSANEFGGAIEIDDGTNARTETPPPGTIGLDAPSGGGTSAAGISD